MTDDEITAIAQAMAAQMGQVRRRPRPRTAPILAEAEHQMLPTPVGAVASWRLGDGPAVLLVHGWEDDNSLWQPLGEALFEAGVPFVAIDLPGHGFSEGDGLTLQGGGAAVAAVAQAAAPIFAVVTHSFGGPLTVEAIEYHGFRPERAVLIASPLAQAEQFARMGARHGAPPEAIARARALVDARTGRPMAVNDLRRAAPAMPCPALFVHSADDVDCPVEASLTLAEIWPGGRSLIVDGFGHRNVARDPQIAAAIVSFLTEG